MSFLSGGIVSLAILILVVYCVFDVIRSDETLIRNLPKVLWVVLVVLTGPIGAVAWLVLGRPEGAARTPGSTDYRAPRKPVGPEDSPSFMSALEEKKRLEKWEEELRLREEKLRRAEEEGEEGKEP
jgi:hypothetical protein